jgi:hypothetical protein
MLGNWLKLLILLLAIESVWATDASFNASIRVSHGILITKVQDLIFPNTMLTGANFNVTVAATAAGAATFNARGRANRNLTRSVVQSSITLSAPGVASTITVSNFTLRGPTRFDSTGWANNLRVGARARVRSNSVDGDYVGVATFRVVYN